MMSNTFTKKPASFTRHSKSLVGKFVRTGQWHFIPLYYLLRLSDFAREGMEHGGSFRFADHMYRRVPSGRGWVGKWLDAALLQLPATRSMGQRCTASHQAMRVSLEKHQQAKGTQEFRILTVPCGLPRDVRELAQELEAEQPGAARQIFYEGFDLDPAVVQEAQEFLAETPLGNCSLKAGDALQRSDFPAVAPDFIASTGLGEFLGDEELLTFYGNIHETLAPGGTFFTSAAKRETLSATLLQAFELEAQYRDIPALRGLLEQQPWKQVELMQDDIGLQIYVRAVKA